MNHLYYGDNLTVLRESIADESVDLIYLDPPFNSNASYNVLFRGPKGNESTAQIEAFDDTWHWSDSAEEAFQEVRRSNNAAAATMLTAMRQFLGENDMMAYLAMMAVRLLELHRVLKPTGSLYLHCDPTASHYLKILLDAVFGAKHFSQEIVWRRTNSHNFKAKNFHSSHDIILYYRKGLKFTYNPQYGPYSEAQLSRFKKDSNGRLYKAENMTVVSTSASRKFTWRGTTPPDNRAWGASYEQLEEWWSEGRILKRKDGSPRMDGLVYYLDDLPGKVSDSVWDDIARVANISEERLGYPTQKPVALLERIVSASSNPGDVVLDPFCGCGTTVHAAEKLGRTWIGIDVTHLAIGLIEKRLRDAFPAVAFTTHGVPQDISGARDLARRGREDGKYYFEFEKWALSLIAAQPGNLSKKGADRGIDGNIFFGKTGRAIVSVKAGDNVSVAMIRDLRGVIEREGAEIGIFLTLTEPKRTMLAEAAAAGQFEMEGFAPVPRLQVVSVEEALSLRDRAVRLPARRDDAFRKAAREEDRGAQGALDL
ncbi:site-specific DNA-methyltransferase [Histidinibacterium lentulum]|uniref:site-specific DNA-methyltransferase (adenine-specific) n=1 Tax=Histidinibacterium lentulum TaxID=2480588 RepID=A0A3N2R503_9RHOB|nr:DNA methyltransferase [Histidinibacterium lentulum]ROU02487.1 site-specific DNA-methyltransferase [Histidinibacterium lentulum]